jgi:hypothetical protein
MVRFVVALALLCHIPQLVLAAQLSSNGVILEAGRCFVGTVVNVHVKDRANQIGWHPAGPNRPAGIRAEHSRATFIQREDHRAIRGNRCPSRRILPSIVFEVAKLGRHVNVEPAVQDRDATTISEY